MNVIWTPFTIAKLKALREKGLSYQHISSQLGCTPDAARAAHKRHVSGRPDEADPEAASKRSRDRAAALAAWERANREKRNADKRRRRAEAKPRA